MGTFTPSFHGDVAFTRAVQVFAPFRPEQPLERGVHPGLVEKARVETLEQAVATQDGHVADRQMQIGSTGIHHRPEELFDNHSSTHRQPFPQRSRSAQGAS